MYGDCLYGDCLVWCHLLKVPSKVHTQKRRSYYDVNIIPSYDTTLFEN